MLDTQTDAIFLKGYLFPHLNGWTNPGSMLCSAYAQLSQKSTAPWVMTIVEVVDDY